MNFSDEVKCVFFSEFHHIAGPKITCQVPTDFPLRDAFDEVHDLIITKPQLYDRLISVDVAGYRVVGCPKCIDDKKYKRNAFIFNFVFVFDSSTDHTPYEPLIQKIGEAFRTYELESSFLSEDTPQKVAKLSHILTTIRDRLNTCGFCTINIDATNDLHLKIVPLLQEPPTVLSYHVPIFTCTREDITNVSWDLTIEQILPYVNGFNHIQKIAMESDVNIDIVMICVQHLIVYKFVKLISIFQYSNMYVCLPKVKTLLTNTNLQSECLDYVAMEGSTPKASDVFRLFCSLEAGLTVRDLCNRNDLSAMGINERMLVQFGLMRDLIRRLQKYPVLGPTVDIEEAPPLPELQPLTEFANLIACLFES
ncbi:GATOR1 complex protein NPRL2-like isoform X2 [Halichondria panicea]|uniref:GATOR1 complex protein NPRL2-like isoform X2 n=1 Tax=Halichondria panicea TaxID=6063 RepID=UPI00312B8110